MRRILSEDKMTILIQSGTCAVKEIGGIRSSPFPVGSEEERIQSFPHAVTLGKEKLHCEISVCIPVTEKTAW